MAEVSDTGLVKTARLDRRRGDHGPLSGASRRVPRDDSAGRRRSTSCRRRKNFIDELVFAKLKPLGMPPSAVCDDCDVPPPRDGRHRRPAADDRRDRAVPGRQRPEQAREAGSTSCWRARDYADYFANKWAAILRNKRRQRHATSARRSRSTTGFARACTRTSRTTSSCARSSPPPATIGAEPAGRLVSRSEGADAAARRHGPVVPGPADSMCPLPPPSVREVEPAGLLRLRGVLLRRSAASRARRRTSDAHLSIAAAMRLGAESEDGPGA